VRIPAGCAYQESGQASVLVWGRPALQFVEVTRRKIVEDGRGGVPEWIPRSSLIAGVLGL
jgi:hypothetical protein